MRPSNDEYFIGIAKAVAKRATCHRRSVGCVFVDKNQRIISTGYNSVASKLSHCNPDTPCPGAFDKSGDTSKCIARHAEEIAIGKCNDIYQIHTVYLTDSPCIKCTRMLLDTSCVRVVFDREYTDKSGQVLWESRGLRWNQIT